MKTFLLSTILALALAGCKTTNPVITKSLVTTSVSAAVAIGLQKSPDALPYLRAASPIVCSAANGTNLNPAAVVAALESSPAASLKTPSAVIIIGAALSLYSTLWDEYGSDPVKNQPQLRAWLQGTCDGLNLALPQSISEPRKLPVHVN